MVRQADRSLARHGMVDSANALTSIIEYIRATYDRRYRWVITNTVDLDRGAKGGDFTNNYLDDTR